MYKLSDTVERKFIESIDINDWEILTDTGWVDVSQIHKTVEYEVYILTTEFNKELKGADTHILFDEDGNEIFLKDCIPGVTSILTKDGPELVTSVIRTGEMRHMYDITVDHPNHRYYTNDILSHNTTTVAAVIAWCILFNKEYTIACLAHKQDQAIEIIDRVKTIYENLPLWLQHGIIAWNKKSIELENKSEVFAAATSSGSVRGKTINFVYADEFAIIETNLQEEFFTGTFPTISSGTESKFVISSCVTPDTMVFTDKGIKTVGDFVDYSKPHAPNLGYEIEPYKVLGWRTELNNGNVVVNNGLSKTRKIRLSYADIHCSLEHKLYVRSADTGKYGWKKAGELTVDDQVAVKYGMNVWGDKTTHDIVLSVNDKTKNEFKFNGVITPGIAYFIGRVIGDGCYNTQTQEPSPSSSLFEFLQTLGIDFNLKSENKFISSVILTWHEELIVALIAGLFDSDSRVSKTSFYNTSEKLIDQIRVLLLNFGILSTKNKTIMPNDLVEAESIGWTLEINNDHHKLFHDIVNLRIKRNPDRIIHPDVVWCNVLDIEESEAEVYDFSLDHVEGDEWCHSVLYNGIVGHQTPKGFNLFYKIWTDAVEKRSDFVPIEINYWDVPGRTPAWAEKERKRIGDAKFRQEYCVTGDTLVTVQDENSNKFDITMEELYGLQNSKNLKVLTPSGFQDFDRVLKVQRNKLVTLSLIDGTILQGSDTHWVKKTDNTWAKIPDLQFGDEVQTYKGSSRVSNISISDTEIDLYDLVNVKNGNEYYTNGILSHNCTEFQGSSNTLIDGKKLGTITYIDPIMKDPEEHLHIFEQPVPGKQYVMSVDVSEGVGGDFSTFSVIDVSEVPYRVVATYANDMITTLMFPNVIFDVAQYFNNAYVVIEANTVGAEVANILHYDLEYENVLSSNIKSKRGELDETPRSYLGIKTTKKTKHLGCSNLKLLIEQDQLIINDFRVFYELSRFVRKGSSFQAEQGEHDDLVMNLVMFAYLTTQNSFKELTNTDLRLAMNQRKIHEQENLPIGIWVSSGIENEVTDLPLSEFDRWLIE